MLYTEIALGWGTEATARPDTPTASRLIASLALIAISGALMLLPPAVAVFVLVRVIA